MKTAGILICLLTGFITRGQSIEGNWKGSLSIMDKRLKIVFHFVKQTDGSYKTTFDSPDQQVFNLQANTPEIKGDSLFINIPLIKGGYYGKIDNDSISGTWQQGPGKLPLNLHRSTEVAAIPPKKPQTPEPPYPYLSQEVTYTNADKTITYGATFTCPENSNQVPVVILISGSGQQDRDCSIMGHKWFLVLADYLTKNGFAVLRVDDRGIGQTTGDVLNATSADFATDVEQGIRYLKTRNEIDVKKIGLVGHSEGGLIAPMVAARNKDVAYIIMLAGPGIGGAVINEEQNVANLKKAGESDSAIKAFRLLHRDLQQASINAKSDSEFETLVRAAITKSETKTKTNGNGSKAGNNEARIMATIKQYNTLRMPWFKFFMNYKPTDDIAKLRIPVLALNGSKDTQVDAGMNLPVIKKALAKNKSLFSRTQSMDGLNHLFQKCVTGEVGEYATIEETINPAAMQIISDWLKQVTK